MIGRAPHHSTFGKTLCVTYLCTDGVTNHPDAFYLLTQHSIRHLVPKVGLEPTRR